MGFLSGSPRRKSLAPDIRDGDGDGLIYDGTENERAAPVREKPVPRKPIKRGSKFVTSLKLSDFDSAKEWARAILKEGSAPPRHEDSGSGPGSQPGVKHLPFSPVPKNSKNSDHAEPLSDEDVVRLSRSGMLKRVFANREIPEGERVGLRIDVSTYNDSGRYVVTVHNAPKTDSAGQSAGRVVGYDGMARVRNPVFWNNEGYARVIQEGQNKATIASVRGEIVQDRTVPGDINDWTAVGYNPKKAVFYYDKKSGEEVVSGDEAISIGNTVFVRGTVYGKRNAATDYNRLSSPEHEEVYESVRARFDRNAKKKSFRESYEDVMNGLPYYLAMDGIGNLSDFDSLEHYLIMYGLEDYPELFDPAHIRFHYDPSMKSFSPQTSLQMKSVRDEIAGLSGWCAASYRKAVTPSEQMVLIATMRELDEMASRVDDAINGSNDRQKKSMPEIRDGDGDGLIYDGTENERSVSDRSS